MKIFIWIKEVKINRLEVHLMKKKKNKIEDDDGYYANTTDLPSKKK